MSRYVNSLYVSNAFCNSSLEASSETEICRTKLKRTHGHRFIRFPIHCILHIEFPEIRRTGTRYRLSDSGKRLIARFSRNETSNRCRPNCWCLSRNQTQQQQEITSIAPLSASKGVFLCGKVRRHPSHNETWNLQMDKQNTVWRQMAYSPRETLIQIKREITIV